MVAQSAADSTTAHTARGVDLILGVPIDRLTVDGALAQILALAAAHTQPTAYVATVNVDFLVNTQSWWPGAPRHPELLDALREAALVTADGMPVVWASRLLGGALPARVAGSDLVPMLARAAAPRRMSLYFLGGAGTAAQDAADQLVREHTGLRIAGVDSPFVHVAGAAMAMSDEEDAVICERINAARPDILLIGFGNPKQEIWFARNRHRLRVGVALGVGGTFNFLTGRVARAPEWMQRSGLEWVFRLMAEPGRLWKRYAIGLFKYGCMMLSPLAVAACSRRARGASLQAVDLPGAAGTGLLLRLPSLLDASLDDSLLAVPGMADEGRVLILDARRVRAAGAGGLGALLSASRRARDAAQTVLLFAPSRALRRSLVANRAWDFWSRDTCPDASALSAALRLRWPGFAYLTGLTREGERLRVDVVGELAGDAMAELNRGTIAEGLSGHDLVFDLSCCSRADSNAVGLLARLQRDLGARGHHLYVRDLSPSLENAMKQAGLGDIPRLKAPEAGPA